MNALTAVAAARQQELDVLRVIAGTDHGISAVGIADLFLCDRMNPRRVNVLLDRLSMLGWVISGWHAAPGAPPDSRPGRYWRLTAAGAAALAEREQDR